MDLPPYQYHTLPTEDAIRILALNPAHNYDDKLSCNILIQSRSVLLQSTDTRINNYEAVSYAWGQHDFAKVLVCDQTYQIRITSNVEGLLRRLRKRLKVRNLWVDAVCLDQASNMEKAQQVPLMASIYHQASKVIVWLGDDALGVQELFAFIRTIASLDNTTEQSLVHLAQAILGKTEHRDLLGSFFSRPWFHRRWILQEASKGRSTVVRCHNEKMSWKWLVDGCDRLRGSSEYQLLLNVLSRRALDTVQMIEGHGDDLLELMWNLDHAQCSDLNDRLFALYGLLKLIDIPIRVDYEVLWYHNYTDFASYCISHGGFLEILRHLIAFGSLSIADSSRATWVPDWSRLRLKSLPKWTTDVNGTLSDGVRIKSDMSRPALFLRCSSIAISHIFAPEKLDWDLEELINWIPTLDSPIDPKESRAGGLWTSRDEKIFEVITLGISRLLDTSAMTARQQRALVKSLEYFGGNFTISSEYVFSRREILLPWLRILLQEFTLFACQNGSQVCMFGISSGDVRLGDSMLLENKTIWDKDVYCKIGCVIRVNTIPVENDPSSWRLVGVCLHPGRYRAASVDASTYLIT